MRPQIILLVGMQGCGKSTYAKEYVKKSSKKFTIISQDELGRKEHYNTFKEAISKRENIIIDRINHTQTQRDKYLSLAREFNYYTTIINLNIELKECVRRVLSRKNHPSFNPKTYKEAAKAMYQFLKEYEPPIKEEYDEFIDETGFDPYCLDISSKYSNVIIIGDIHGCFDELSELLSDSKIKTLLESSQTAIVCLGDLIDKGPKSREVLNWFFESKKRQRNYYCVRGNHEYKLQRYLRGNNIELTHGIEKTIEQCRLDPSSKHYDSKYAQLLLEELDSLPFMIKIATNAFVTHAGLNPTKHVLRQPKEYLLFARTFNPITHSFNTTGDAPWFEMYDKNKPIIYFGHQYFENIAVKENIFCLDGYCVYGGELRAAIIKKNSKNFISSQEFISAEAKEKYHENEGISNSNFLKHYDELVNLGYLKKSQKKDLVLYNYTQKTMYEKNWNSSTMQARGIIFNLETQEIIARPFGKFFNINETEFTQLHNLPTNESFEVFEKVDGVLGIIFFYNNSWQLTTRGEFDSVQAIIGQELLKSQIDTSKLNPKYTYLCEIVHPKCRVVLSYNNSKKLILIGAIETKTGTELDYKFLCEIAKKSGFEIISKINSNLTLEELYKNRENWSSENEGYVIRFNSGLRVKIKSSAYISLVELENELTIYKLIKFITLSGKIDNKYFKNIPEELEKRVYSNISFIEEKFREIKTEIEEDLKEISRRLKINENNNSNNSKNNELKLNIKKIANIIYNYDKSNQTLNHPKVLIPYIKYQEENIMDYMKKEIKRRI